VELLDDDKLRDTRYGNLHLYGVVKDESMKKLDLLKLCSKNKCWSVIDKKHFLKQKDKKQISQSYSTFLIGKMVFKDINETIESIEYKYNGKQGVIKLKDKLYFAQAVIDVMYLKFDEKVKEHLVTIAPPIKYLLYISDENYEYKNEDGVIVKIEKNTLSTPAIVAGTFASKNKDSLIYKFYFLNDSTKQLLDKDKIFNETNRDTVTTIISKTLLKNILIFIPINISPTEEDKFKKDYSMELDHRPYEYEFDYINNKNYIKVITNKSNINIDLRNQQQWGIR
jgi:hypothetical protein